jgi:hypothetical protein
LVLSWTPNKKNKTAAHTLPHFLTLCHGFLCLGHLPIFFLFKLKKLKNSWLIVVNLYLHTLNFNKIIIIIGILIIIIIIIIIIMDVGFKIWY